MKILIIRHVSWNKKQNRIPKEGKKQIRKIINKIKKLNIKFKLVYSSPSKRALILAKEISKEFSLPLKINKLLKERNEGVFKNIPNHEKIIEQKAKEEGKDILEYRPPRGESILDVYKRTKRFIKKLKKNSIVVTHYTNIVCFYSIAKNKNLKEVWNKNLIKPEFGKMFLLDLSWCEYCELF